MRSHIADADSNYLQQGTYNVQQSREYTAQWLTTLHSNNTTRTTLSVSFREIEYYIHLFLSYISRNYDSELKGKHISETQK